MSIIHPVAAFIARSILSQSESCGDGTISVVLLICEILRYSENYIKDGIHPSVLFEGLNKALSQCIEVLDSLKVEKRFDSESLLLLTESVCRTKVPGDFSSKLAKICTEAVVHVREESGLDLSMIELMQLKSGSIADTRLVKGLVLDHGGRHPSMPKRLENVGVLLLNVSLEYEKTEINSSIIFKTAAQKEALAVSERKFVEDRANRIVDSLNSCSKFSSFLIINQKGIDPYALDIFAKRGILALRRAKRRNMERIIRLCGGSLFNSVDNISQDGLGSAGLVHEKAFGEEKYTFIEQTPLDKSCTILITGPSEHSMNLLRDTIKACIRVCDNFHQLPFVVPGAGSTFLMLNKCLKVTPTAPFEERVGVELCRRSFYDVFKTILINAGQSRSRISDNIDSIISSENVAFLGPNMELLDPWKEGMWDSYHTMKSLVSRSITVASTILMMDEILRAGKMVKKE